VSKNPTNDEDGIEFALKGEFSKIGNLGSGIGETLPRFPDHLSCVIHYNQIQAELLELFGHKKESPNKQAFPGVIIAHFRVNELCNLFRVYHQVIEPGANMREVGISFSHK
jgi:hypothetical protein